jgi:hypothetical protein
MDAANCAVGGAILENNFLNGYVPKRPSSVV